MRKRRNEEARGMHQMNRNLGAASALSGRAGVMPDNRAKNRAQQKAALKREFR